MEWAGLWKLRCRDVVSGICCVDLRMYGIMMLRTCSVSMSKRFRPVHRIIVVCVIPYI